MKPKDKLKAWSKEAYIRYFPQFAGIWTSFNSWYNEYFDVKMGISAPTSDRGRIDKIKDFDKRYNIVKEFWNICERDRPELILLINQIERIAETQHLQNFLGFAQYTKNNIVTRFVEQAWTNSIVKDRLWCGDGSDRPTKKHHSKPIATLYISPSIYREIYSQLMDYLNLNAISDVQSVQNVLLEFGIQSIGSCFYLDPRTLGNGRYSGHALYIRSSVKNYFGKLIRAKSQSPKGLFADIIEMLYTVRNLCIHGEFDEPSNIENNELFQAAYEFLYTLILATLKEKIGKLHP